MKSFLCATGENRDAIYTNWLMSSYSTWTIVAQVSENIEWFTRNGLSGHWANKGLRDYSEDSDAVY